MNKDVFIGYKYVLRVVTCETVSHGKGHGADRVVRTWKNFGRTRLL